MNGETVEANLAYDSIYKTAKNKIYVIDNYIGLKTLNEQIYHCGASSKDAGNKIMSISKVNENHVYHQIIDTLLNNPILTLK